MNKSAFHQLSYGVYVVSTWDQGRATGGTANSAMQITSEPATVAVSINHDNYTNQCIRSTGRFAVSILGENSDPGIIGAFGFKSGKDNDKFAQVEHVTKEHMPVVADACGYIVCEVIDSMEAEDLVTCLRDSLSDSQRELGFTVSDRDRYQQLKEAVETREAEAAAKESEDQ